MKACHLVSLILCYQVSLETISHEILREKNFTMYTCNNTKTKNVDKENLIKIVETLVELLNIA